MESPSPKKRFMEAVMRTILSTDEMIGVFENEDATL
jgi:hypothetical protein